ncbi:alpha/beta hydrolase family protein [Marinilabilia salmonicolor]|nr:hypothetical protein [Marinilabilia salmonicolor]
MRILIFLTVAVLSFSCSKVNNGHLNFFDANPEAGYYYPFFLFIPEGTSAEKQLTLIVEPNNSGFVDDDFSKHKEKAERIAKLDFYMGNYLSVRMKQPLLVPVFPRSRSDWQIYTHALDRDALLQKGNSLERMDLQLIRMVDRAKLALKEMGYELDEQIFMTGFSASGTFANRFTALHPDKVKAMAAGGINGLLILPCDSLADVALHYPLGISDIDSLAGIGFQESAFAATPQFLFMGAMDDNDAIPYEDGYSIQEREQVFQLLGKQMMPDRWENCIEIYQQQGVNAVYKTYQGIGHEQTPEIKDEVLAFFKEKLE